MKKYIVMIVLLFAGLEGQSQNLIVQESNSVETCFLLTTLQKITFNGGAVQIVQTDGQTASFSIDQINKLFFGVSSGMKESVVADTKELVRYISSDLLQVNCAAGEQISIYRVDGSMVLKQHQSSDGGTLNIAALPKGLYLLKVNHQTVKIAKR